MCNCNSKCPLCWTEKDTEELYNEKMRSNDLRYYMGKIDKDTWQHNRSVVVKFDGVN